MLDVIMATVMAPQILYLIVRRVSDHEKKFYKISTWLVRNMGMTAYLELVELLAGITFSSWYWTAYRGTKQELGYKL
jgi:hypothetical protein